MPIKTYEVRNAGALDSNTFWKTFHFKVLQLWKKIYHFLSPKFEYCVFLKGFSWVHIFTPGFIWKTWPPFEKFHRLVLLYKNCIYIGSQNFTLPKTKVIQCFLSFKVDTLVLSINILNGFGKFVLSNTVVIQDAILHVICTQCTSKLCIQITFYLATSLHIYDNSDVKHLCKMPGSLSTDVLKGM